jgi:hypothetical protein
MIFLSLLPENDFTAEPSAFAKATARQAMDAEK